MSDHHNHTHVLRDTAVLRDGPAPDALLAIEDAGLRHRALEAWRAAQTLARLLCGWSLYAICPRPEAVMTFPVEAHRETRLAVQTLRSHGAAVPFFRGRSDDEIVALLCPSYPQGAISAERDAAFLAEVRDNAERLQDLREETERYIEWLVQSPAAALSALRPVGAGQTDRKTDKPKKRARDFPRDHRLLYLAEMIKAGRRAGRTDIHVALEFAGDDEKRANSMLRRLRDYPRLLE
jgi:hypothetical protein